ADFGEICLQMSEPPTLIESRTDMVVGFETPSTNVSFLRWARRFPDCQQVMPVVVEARHHSSTKTVRTLPQENVGQEDGKENKKPDLTLYLLVQHLLVPFGCG
ncbi:MAG: hypothetical protein IAG10_25890, partial [Planctomycetaceae bacterium]|nr:hypothetical protein [Planctomycetaceae bacterium]